tara:strand:+ start:446 stop:589 length:144 start_codon:yes stop_codon:yes gene_type:complete
MLHFQKIILKKSIQIKKQGLFVQLKILRNPNQQKLMMILQKLLVQKI